RRVWAKVPCRVGSLSGIYKKHEEMSLMEELFSMNNFPQHNSYPVIVTPSPNGFILNTVDFDDLSVEADNIQYGISCIHSAISQRMLTALLPEPTPANELALSPTDFVVMVTV
ncbi:MAG TPA: hypothetical protein PKI82_12400, partial [Ruminococcus flavefaciens]|nr:hypothetical protein [Ruminococcus flavefaciens]